MTTVSFPKGNSTAFRPAPHQFQHVPHPQSLFLPLSNIQIQPISKIQSGNGKRKREGEETEGVLATASTSAIIESISTRKPRKVIHPKHYKDSVDMMKELQASFKTEEDTTFLGTYHALNIPEISDKQRVQLLVHEIWQVTGYRFTVKDHPPDKNGHTTRLWCSQDIQRKSSKRKISRVSTAGDLLAKPRYPCRSRLLVSSRAAPVTDAGSARTDAEKLVTIRMYHHFPHEPCRDTTLPAIPLRNMYPSSTTPETDATWSPDLSLDSHGKDKQQEQEQNKRLSFDTSLIHHNYPNQVAVDQLRSKLVANPNPHLITEPSFQTETFSFSSASPPASQQAPHNQTPTHTTSPHSTLDTEIFRSKMFSHIRNIRDFCDGLEYQVQFNDFRMLQELEEKGRDFLELVRGCLEREGRLERAVINSEDEEEIDEGRNEGDDGVVGAVSK